ncbi:MAG: hypothetical protein AVDCRST_MAG73-2972 [uncultured Thermomicrobiales bacterium]|uniref:Uncharacterized protein n=1 Tax=uncultured Thermomicrobiales bacterium TaxID=1645740 RepID=A0A6J4UMJ4_9BACT|nr:MAG: hypothetical protein AVDCRST_MAG73-2972 [uncultured Thermomicrobiales bacterium]
MLDGVPVWLDRRSDPIEGIGENPAGARCRWAQTGGAIGCSHRPESRLLVP